MKNSWSLTARWVVPVGTPPIPGGVVTIADGTIAAVEPHGSPADVDLGDVIVMPGLVNAHTHLDLTGMRGQALPTGDFIAWLQQVIAFRKQRSAEQVQADIRAGIAEAARYGTTLLGDIASGGASWDALDSAPFRAVAFYELLGLRAEAAQSALRNAGDWLFARDDSDTRRRGLSPHSPYSFRASLLEPLSKLGLPVAMHLAEWPNEREFLEAYRGPIADFLASLGVFDQTEANPEAICKSPEQAVYRLRRSRPLLAVHGNYLEPDRLRTLPSAIVYCPRTHAAFGHSEYPLRDFLRRGLRVVLGTDGLSSNPDLDLLAEARTVRRIYPDLPPAQVLRMATLDGAKALGFGTLVGSLETGKSADLIVLPIVDSADPERAILESEHSPSAVLFRGRWQPGAPAEWEPPAHPA